MPLQCSLCGFDPSSLRPGDAIVAVRSFPRRFRELASAVAEGDGGGDGDGDADTVLAQAGEAAAAISAIAEDLRRVLISDQPSLTTATTTATASAGGDAPSGLSRLDDAVALLVAAADHQPSTAWHRTGTRGGSPVSALGLLGEAVHAGVHHLKLAEAADGA